MNNMIKTDLENSRIFKDEINKDISRWMDTYDGKKYGNEVEGRSEIVWKLVKKHGEILIANLAKPFISGSNIISLEPRTKQDVYKTNIDNKLLNFFFNKKFDKSKFIKQLIRIMAKEGTSFIKVSWDTRDKKPYAESLYNEDVFTEPNATSIEESKYIIHRFNTTVEELEENPNYSKTAINQFKKYLDSKNNDSFAQSDDLHDRDIGLYQRAKNDSLYLYEYWYKKNDEIYITSFVDANTEALVLSKEKYEYKWYPFVEFPFYDQEFSIWGRALADIIDDEQKFMTAIVRGVIDNMASSNNGQKFVKKGALDSVNMQNMQSGKPVVEINTTEHINTAIQDGHFNELPSSVYNLLNVIESQAEGLTGVSKFMQGINESPNSSATSAQAVLTQSQIRLLDIENNINRGLKKVFRKWIEMIVNYLDDEEMLRITGTTWDEEKSRMVQRLKEQYQLDQMPPETQQKAMILIMKEVEKIYDKSTINYDFKLKIGTDASNQIKINQINMLMQQSAPLVQAGAVPPDIIRKLTSKLFELFDYPDLADEISNYQAQPDPVQQQMIQLEMMNLKAKSDKEEALAKNALARTAQTQAKAIKEQKSIEPDIAKKYTEVAKTAKGINDNNTKNGKPVQ